jgi:hypothetical protein
MAGGEDALDQEVAQMYSPPPLQPSPTGDACAFYLLADGRRSSKFGGTMEEGVEIGHGERREVTESFPPPFRFSPMRAAAPAISILVSARAPKIPFCISGRGDLPAPLKTAEPGVPPGPGPTLL